MQLVKTQPVEVQDIVKPVYQRNAYFADPSVLLAACLESSEEETRRFAVNTILKMRAKPQKPPRAKRLKGIRMRVNPILQWDAASWDKMIKWNKIKLYEPFILMKFSKADLMKAYGEPITFPDYQCHTQSVERAVKMVSEASKVVCGEKRRHEHILAVDASRRERKPFSSKKYYKVVPEE